MIEHQYVLHSDASYFIGRRHCGWAFVLLAAGGGPVIQKSGIVKTDHILTAEIHAIREGLASRANILPTLLQFDIPEKDVERLIKPEDRLKATVKRISKKGENAWHLWCHQESRRQALNADFGVGWDHPLKRRGSE